MPLSGISNPYFIFFIYLAVGVCCLVFFFLLGLLIFKFIGLPQIKQDRSPFFFSYLSILAGSLIFSITVSLYYSKFETIQICFLILFFLGLITASKKPYNFNWKQHLVGDKGFTGILKLLSLLGFALLGYFLLQFYFTVSAYNFPFYQPSADLTFYSTLSDYLIISGYENTYHAFGMKDASFRQMVPYHYFELWLTGGLSSFSGLNTFLVLTLVVSPLFYTLIFLGIISIFEFFGKLSIWVLLISFLFPLMDRLNFGFFYDLPLINYADSFSSILLSVSNNNVSKIGPYYLFLIPSIIFALAKNYRIAVLFLLGLPVATITVAPAIFMGLLSSLVILVLVKKISFRDFLLYGGYIFLLATIMATLYYFNRSTTPIVQTSKELSLVNILTSGTELSGKFNLFIGNWIVVFFVYSPFIVLIIYTRWREGQWLSKFDLIYFISISIIFCGFLSWAVLSHVANASQLGTRISTALLNLVLFVSTVLIISESKQFKMNRFLQGGTACLFTIWLLFNGFKFFHLSSDRPRISEEYGDAVIHELHSNANSKLIGCLIAPEDFPHSSVTKNSNFYVSGLYLSLFGSGFRAISLSDYAIPDESPNDGDPLSKYAREGLFFDFVEEQKKEGNYVSLEKSQLAFIVKNKFQYLVLSENFQIPESLKPYIKSQVRDNISKERFVRLHKMY